MAKYTINDRLLQDCLAAVARVTEGKSTYMPTLYGSVLIQLHARERFAHLLRPTGDMDVITRHDVLREEIREDIGEPLAALLREKGYAAQLIADGKHGELHDFYVEVETGPHPFHIHNQDRKPNDPPSKVLAINHEVSQGRLYLLPTGEYISAGSLELTLRDKVLRLTGHKQNLMPEQLKEIGRVNGRQVVGVDLDEMFERVAEFEQRSLRDSGFKKEVYRPERDFFDICLIMELLYGQ